MWNNNSVERLSDVPTATPQNTFESTRNSLDTLQESAKLLPSATQQEMQEVHKKVNLLEELGGSMDPVMTQTARELEQIKNSVQLPQRNIQDALVA